jgi:hypothetical protein
LNDHHSCYSFFFLLLINVFLRIDRLPTMLMLVPVVHIKSSHLSNLLTPQSTYYLLAVTPILHFQSLSSRSVNLHFRAYEIFSFYGDEDSPCTIVISVYSMVEKLHSSGA